MMMSVVTAYTLTGLNNIRVLDCGVHLSVSPENEVVNFGTFSTRDIQRHNITRTFTVKATRAEDAECSDGFKLNAAFFTDEHLSADRLLLRPGMDCSCNCYPGLSPWVLNALIVLPTLQQVNSAWRKNITRN